MPIYDYLCGECAWQEERRVPLVQFNEAQFCSKCGAPMARQISAVYGKMAGTVLQGVALTASPRTCSGSRPAIYLAI